MERSSLLEDPMRKVPFLKKAWPELSAAEVVMVWMRCG